MKEREIPREGRSGGERLGYAPPAPALRLTDPRRSRLLFDEAPFGIIALDLAGAVIDINLAGMECLGAERKALIGAPFIDRVSREDRDDVADQLSKVVMGTAPAARLAGVRIAVAGRHDRVLSLFIRRIDERGNGVGLLVHILDVTERRTLEMNLAQVQKMEAIGQLAGGVAHDFNNLLTAILGFCELAIEREENGEPTADELTQIRATARRASDLVRQLLAFSRRQALQPVPLDVGSSITALTAMLGRLLGPKVSVAVDLQHRGALVRIDPSQFDQVIVNLAVNARDAMPNGGGLTIRTEIVDLPQPTVQQGETIGAGRYVRITVSDTGTGIAKEILGNIFDPFFTTKERGAGTGLGLATVHGIVRQTEGFITVDSALGAGATFSVWLPTCGLTPSATAEGGRAPAGPADQPPSAPPPSPRQGQTILLVEDEDPVRICAARALRSRGYTVVEAASGDLALDFLTNSPRPIDLLLSDVMMPGLDGKALARMVRQRQPQVRILLMSGYAEDFSSKSEGDRLSDDFLMKPFSLSTLIGKVNDAIGG